MLKNKRIVMVALALALVVVLAACGGTDNASSTPASSAAESSVAASSAAESSAPASEAPATGGMTGPINVVTREDGSGTRGAFIEITGVEDESGDRTSPAAAIMQGTNEVVTYVVADKAAIGYISLGSVNDTIKPLKVNDVEATDALIKEGKYPIARPFNIVYKDGSLSEVAQDFRDFMFSKEGQEVVASGYVTVADNAPAYTAKGLPGKVTVEGSTSVFPIMEKLAEAYKGLNKDVQIEITSNGSGPGIKAATAGTTDIGMASRELKEEELKAVKGEAIAMDGIAVIVNKENPIENLTMDQIMKIFIGETTSWDGL